MAGVAQNVVSEITESVSSEKKTVKKKKSSEGVDTTSTKTKKTKKTKKSEEKENHISVMTNGHSSELLKTPVVVTVEEDDLSNVCVRDLKQTYCSEAEKTLKTVKKCSEEPVAAPVPIRELRRSFGDLHKACENAELTPVEQPNINNAQVKACSLGDLRRLSDAPTKLSVHTGVSVKALAASYWSLVTNNESSPTPSLPYASKSRRASTDSSKSSFSKFDQLQKKTLLHVRSSDSAKAQKQFNQGSTESLNPGVNPSCKSCGKTVFAMEQIKAERCVWHKNCFRCKECNKQLTLDIYSSHEGQLYCKPHFRELFKPKAVVDNNEDEPVRRRKPEMIIRENQPVELPPDVVRASDKPDLGLEELNSLNVKSRFQVFEKSGENEVDRSPSAVNVKRSPSILSKLAKFQKKGMDVGVTDESLNGVDYEESSSSSEDEDGKTVRKDGVVRSSKLVERPTSFGKMEDVKRTWESGQAARKEERREERKQEIQSIRSRLFMGKQGKMKEMYEQAVAESEGRGGTGIARKEVEALKSDKARAVRERFERGEVLPSDSEEEGEKKSKEQEDMSIFEAGISKKSRSLFLEMDANVAKSQTAMPLSPVSQPVNNIEGPRRLSNVSNAKRQVSTEDIVRSSDTLEDVTVQTADVSSKFKFFETYKAPEKERKAFRITPPREGQVKAESPDREIYRDPTIIRSDDRVEDDSVIKRSQTTSKMLSIFRQMEEAKESVPDGPKPLKRFTPPPDYKEEESGTEEEEESEEEEEEEESEEDNGIVRASDKVEDEFLKQAQNAARAKTLKEKFEHWEPEKQSKNNAINMLESDQASLDSTKSLRARFESLKSEQPKEKARPKVNRFVVQQSNDSLSICAACEKKVYLLEKVETNGKVFHKACFRCTQCGCILRMETYTLNNGQLYCLPHFKQLFIVKGNYDEGFGIDQHKRKWEATTINGSH
ncbi:uncharacterized protein LOC142329075 isoform X17 [Lycorma delicatula]